MMINVCMLWCITYRILRQSRPSRRRWTASSSSWPFPRLLRLLPPAAAPLETAAGRPDRGQYSAAISGNKTCRITFRSSDATDQRLSSASATTSVMRRKEAPALPHTASYLLRGFYWRWLQSIKYFRDSIGPCAGDGNHCITVRWQQQCHDNLMKLLINVPTSRLLNRKPT